MTELRLPHLGEGIDSATVIGIIAKVGDTIKIDDPVIEIETDKAVVPVPSTVEGVVGKIASKDGDTIKPGDLILTIAEGSAAATPEKKEEKPSSEVKTATPAPAPEKNNSSAFIEFRLPDLGEGIEGGTVIGVIVKAGDTVKKEDPILELETDKAVIPVPSPSDGIIKEIKIKDGQSVKVGEHLFTVSSSSEAASAPVSSPAPKVESKESLPAVTVTPATQNTSASVVVSSGDFAAGPATRKLARELGVDLGRVNGTARGGRITIEDLKSYVKSALQKGTGGSGSSKTAGISLPSLPNFANFGPVHREKISKLRKTVSERMVSYWTIPHVHQFNEIDVTNIIELQGKYAKDFKDMGSSLSLTQFIIKAMVETVKQFPAFNASFDHLADELILKDYYNVGVAVDTPSGLIVPVLKGVDKMSIFDIGKTLKELATKTRDRKISVDDLQGASITLSNLGGIGGTSFTPIINYPETAIVGASKSVIKPVFINGEFKPRHIMNLCIAYDHRVIDGADGARFIKTFSDYLENIEKNLML